jgi:hypothetical protein
VPLFRGANDMRVVRESFVELFGVTRRGRARRVPRAPDRSGEQGKAPPKRGLSRAAPARSDQVTMPRLAGEFSKRFIKFDETQRVGASHAVTRP